MPSVAIIGAGLAGLTAAHYLKDHAQVTVFEKARGVSGRMSTRRAEPYFFDHGAQYFTARLARFRAFLQPLIAAGIIAPWHARFVEIEHNQIIRRRQWDDEYPHYVGVPGMNAVAKSLAAELDIRVATRVGGITRSAGSWLLQDEEGQRLGEYDWVISAIPAEQAAVLLPDSLDFHAQIQQTKASACFSLMLGFAEPLTLDFDAAMIRQHELSWISVNNAKPKRAPAFSLLVHSDNQWADQHVDDDREQVRQFLMTRLSDLLDQDVSAAAHQVMHAWRYANIGKQAGDDYFLDAEQHLGVCGDWLVQGRVEAAFQSASGLAEAIQQTL